MRLRGVLPAVVLVSAAAVCAACPAAFAAVAPQPVAGRFYDAIGPSALGFVLKTSSSGRRLTVSGYGYNVVCGAGPNRGQEPELDAPVRTTRIAGDGSFAVSLPVKDDPPIELAGRVLAGTIARGTVSWRATERDLAPCPVHERWTARLRPLNDYFKGTTSSGVAVSFAVSVAPSPALSEFSVSGVQTTCPPRRAAASETSPSDTPFESISDGYVGRVHSGGKFHAETEDSNGEAFVVTGRLSGERATGVVSLDDRDDCGYSGVHWTASFVRRGL
jgi:hypothetical protein